MLIAGRRFDLLSYLEALRSVQTSEKGRSSVGRTVSGQVFSGGYCTIEAGGRDVRNVRHKTHSPGTMPRGRTGKTIARNRN